jgi:uncharacterized damage-inducible protein DinB
LTGDFNLCVRPHALYEAPMPAIAPAYVATMARYNAEMNRRLYDAASRLTDEARRQDRGAFWGSVHGTLCHLLWADTIWMSRFDGWATPAATIRESPNLIEDFAELRAARGDADARLIDFAHKVSDDWLEGDLTWFSGAAQRELTAPRDFLLMHVFNHQTHHRGQAHALITAAGEDTGDTDLFLLVAPPTPSLTKV